MGSYVKRIARQRSPAQGSKALGGIGKRTAMSAGMPCGPPASFSASDSGGGNTAGGSAAGLGGVPSCPATFRNPWYDAGDFPPQRATTARGSKSVWLTSTFTSQPSALAARTASSSRARPAKESPREEKQHLSQAAVKILAGPERVTLLGFPAAAERRALTVRLRVELKAEAGGAPGLDGGGKDLLGIACAASEWTAVVVSWTDSSR